MADKLLKSIKFPTLPDRYVIGDSTLTEEGAAADAKAVGDALATKADTNGRYGNLIVGGAEQLMADGCESDSDPYLFRPTGGSADVGNREYLDKIVGGTVAWNQLVLDENRNFTSTASDTRPFTLQLRMFARPYTTAFVSDLGLGKGVYTRLFVGIDTQGSGLFLTHNGSDNNIEIWRNYNQQLVVGHKYLFNVNVVNNDTTTVGGLVLNDMMLFDLTALFNPTIADYIYSLEQSQAGAGVAWFRRYFPEDYYPYDAGTLKSVQTSAHKTYDADGNVIRTYPLDSSLTLRGVPKLADGKLAFDGDIYPPSGEVQRRYGLRAYQSGDESLADAITDGTNTVYKLSTPTTETADGYDQYQRCDPSGTEEFVTDSIVPVGHETRYPHDLKKKIETAPDSPSTDGTYLMKRSGGKNTYMALPSTPSANGAYVLTVTVSGGTASYSWTAKE